MRNNEHTKSIRKLISDTSKVIALLSVIKDSCILNNYNYQSEMLEMAINLEFDIMDKLTSL